MLATGSSTNDLTARIWDTQSGECLHVLSGHLSWVWCVVWSSDGKHIASGGNDQRVKIWDVTTGTCIQTLHDESLVAMSIAACCLLPCTRSEKPILKPLSASISRYAPGLSARLWRSEALWRAKPFAFPSPSDYMM